MYWTRFNTIPGELRLLPQGISSYFVFFLPFGYIYSRKTNGWKLKTQNTQKEQEKQRVTQASNFWGGFKMWVFWGVEASIPWKFVSESRNHRLVGFQVKKQVNGNQLQICWTLEQQRIRKIWVFEVIPPTTNIEPAQHPFGKGHTFSKPPL